MVVASLNRSDWRNVFSSCSTSLIKACPRFLCRGLRVHLFMLLAYLIVVLNRPQWQQAEQIREKERRGEPAQWQSPMSLLEVGAVSWYLMLTINTSSILSLSMPVEVTALPNIPASKLFLLGFSWHQRAVVMIKTKSWEKCCEAKRKMWTIAWPQVRQSNCIEVLVSELSHS